MFSSEALASLIADVRHREISPSERAPGLGPLLLIIMVRCFSPLNPSFGCLFGWIVARGMTESVDDDFAVFFGGKVVHERWVIVDSKILLFRQD